jgi:hypothetical protein
LFANAAPVPAGGKQVEIVDDYIVVHTSTTAPLVDPAPATVASDANEATSALPILRVRAPGAAVAPVVPGAVAAGAPAPAQGGTTVADPGNDAASQPEEVPLAASPAPDAAAEAPASPTQAAPAKTSSLDSSAPSPTVAALAPATPPVVTAARPPIPDGCVNPRFRSGAWKCDDD